MRSKHGGPFRLICLIGIDGSGKTTHARSLVKEINESGIRCSYVWCRGAPKLFLRFFLRLAKRTLFGRERSENGSVATYRSLKGQVFSNPVMSKIWLTMLLFDTLVQAYLGVCIPLKRGRVVVADRYIFDQMVDIAVDFRLSRFELREWSRNPVYRLFPKPDIVFVMDIDAASAHLRKTDIQSICDLAERRRVYFWLSTFVPMIVVDASDNYDRVHEIIRSKVLMGSSSKLESSSQGETHTGSRVHL